MLAGRSPKLAAFDAQIDPLDRFAPLRRSRLTLTDRRRALPEGPEEFVATRGRPEELAEWALEAEAVRDAMRVVPEDQRQTIELAYFGGLTHVEIAERMRVPLGTVKSRLRIGLEKMREYLRPKVLE